jgi:hypothetical protein
MEMWDGTQWVNAGPLNMPPSQRMEPLFLDPATGMTVIGYDANTGTTFLRDPQGQTYASGATSPREHRPGGAVGTGARPTRPSGGLLTPHQYYQQTFGGLRGVGYRPTTGSSTFDTHAQNLMLMNFVAAHDPTGPSFSGGRNPGLAGDAGQTIFYGRNRGVRDLYGENAALWAMRNAAEGEDAFIIDPLDDIGHHADGARIPGGPSRADNVLAWLSPGEHVFDAFTTAKLDRSLGSDWPAQLKGLTIDVPRFAAGGRAGGETLRSSDGRQASEPAINVHVYTFDDHRAAIRAYNESPEGRKFFRESTRRSS